MVAHDMLNTSRVKPKANDNNNNNDISSGQTNDTNNI